MTATRLTRVGISFALALGIMSGWAHAQNTDYPNRPIRMLVGFAAGGGTDVAARIMAQKMSEILGQTILVENRTGASGLIAAQDLAKSDPDGYTLMMGSQTTCAVAPALYHKVTVDPVKDFSGVALTGASPLVLVAKLVRPHGRRGEMLADILTDFPERFHERSRLFLAPPGQVGTPAREIGIENFWFLRDRMVVKLQGIDSINDAEGLRGYELAIPPAERVPLADGAAYVSDLIGCSVIDLNSDGVNIGEVVDVDRGSSSTDLLVVKLRGGHGEPVQALIPFVRDYLAHMDAASRRIEMRLPEGLLEINAPMTEEEKRESSEQREGEGHRSRERRHKGPRGS